MLNYPLSKVANTIMLIMVFLVLLVYTGYNLNLYCHDVSVVS